MRNLNYELIINRNETFTLDFELVNNDGSPYIVYSKLRNPYILITIWSIHNQLNPYICNYWLSLEDLPRFAYTQPLQADDFSTYPPTFKGEKVFNENEDIDLTGRNAVFLQIDAKGNKTYKYYYNGEYLDYDFRIIKTFSVKDTAELTSQNYNYSIKIMSGMKLNENSDVPIDMFDDVDVILPPTKFTVVGDPNGGYNGQ